MRSICINNEPIFSCSIKSGYDIGRALAGFKTKCFKLVPVEAFLIYFFTLGEAKEYFKPYYKPISDKFILSLEQRKNVQTWLYRVSTKLFLPELMVGSPIATDKVQLRIATSLIDKLNIPRQYRDYLFDNTIYCFWIRKRAYSNFFWQEIVQLPFAPDYRLNIKY